MTIFQSSLGLTFLFTLLFSIVMAGAEETNSAPVILRRTANVTGDTVQLVDLLPEHAPASLRVAFAGIELGRSPQPGSLRVLEDSQVKSYLQTRPTVLGQLLVPERITVRRVDWPISRTEAWKAVSRFLQVGNAKRTSLPDAESLRWDSGVRAGSADAALQVTASHWDSRRQAFALRVRCVESSFCGSFLVHVSGEKSGLAGAAAPNVHGTVGLRETGQAADLPQPSPRGHPLAQAGKPANLMVEGDGFRISLPVVCLERGMLGQKIRAVDSSSHRVFWAEVVGADRLLAIF